jgi:ribonuclease T1
MARNAFRGDTGTQTHVGCGQEGQASRSGLLQRAGAAWRSGAWRWLLATALTLGASGAVVPVAALARTDAPAAQTAAEPVALSSLPVQAREVHSQILAGGPFRYDKDGTVFRNRERLLPIRPRGHYREYTVPTPGERTRGARRIVCGGKEVRAPETCYYTRDHYASFQQIDPAR